MNVKETLLEQQATIDRIETLKEEMHNLSKFGLGLSETDLFPINSATKASLSTMHFAITRYRGCARWCRPKASI